MVRWDFLGCDVDHGYASYEELVDTLFRIDPKMIAECAKAEYQFETEAQRKRNLRAAGIH
jgi:hypothetical protein